MNVKSSFSHKIQEPESNTLYIVGTPIGNLNDLSLRALNVLKNASLIACEDTRHTKKLMSKFEFTNTLISFNKFNSEKKIPKIINYLNSGKSIALVSDAGMPSICDPGEDLVKQVKLNGIKLVCIPGPCAALTALVSSGMPSSQFIFEGFLPKNTSDRRKILLEVKKNEKTTILFESPHRLIKLLNELKEICGGGRGIQVSRELTKRYEEHIGSNVEDVLRFFEDKEIKGEITIVIKGIKKNKRTYEFNEFELKQELKELMSAGLSLSAASKYLAKKKNLTKSSIYSLR
tara:strand:- start:1244 stop:2110 length:867 start_codon:yes stop_codon:yes gene_type:complete